MASSYLGNIPSNNFVSLKRQVITGNGGASYTLDHSVASVNDVAIFVNNVRQDPASYSISGTALTLGGTISSSDSCYVIFLGQALQTVTPDADTITTAMLKSNAVDLTSKVTGTLPVANGGTALTSGFANGITMADQFRTSATISNPSGGISTNFERADNATFAKIGTGMTESSGLFTFPVTGLYLVEWNFTMQTLSDAAVNFYIRVTANNGASFDNVARTLQGNINSSTEYNSARSVCFVNVTDISNFKVQFYIDSGSSNLNLTGNTAYNVTSYTFIRLGDSQ